MIEKNHFIVTPARSNCGEISCFRPELVDSACFVAMWLFVVLSFLLGTLKPLTYAHAVRGRPTLKDVIERMFWLGSVRELKESYIENKCALNEQIYENHDMNYTDMNCFETKYQTRKAQNCESLQEKKVGEHKVSTADAIELQKDSLLSRMHLVKILKKKVNFLSICIIMAVCFLLLLNFCVFRAVVLFHIQLFESFRIILTNVVSILYHAWCSVLCLDEPIFNAFNDCDLFKKGAQLSVVVDVDNEESINDLQFRFRYAKFVYCKCLKGRRHVVQKDGEPSRISAKQLTRALQENIFENATQPSVVVDIDKKESVNNLQLRSRYAKFVYCKCVGGRQQRDREPSRIPVKQLSRALHKSRSFRKLVRKYIKKNVPKSSAMHLFTKLSVLNRKLDYLYVRLRSAAKKRSTQRTWWTAHRRKKPKTRRGRMKLRCNYTSVRSVYKNVNHRMNHTELKLSNDIEKNPGPIDHTKTIQAPYSQGNVELFGQNAGTQCVAMSLTSLIYNYRNNIISSVDLINIMNIGNELYSGLSRLSRQTFLLLTELPAVLNVFNTDYQLQYSSSYSGTINGRPIIHGLSFCMPLIDALLTLIRQNYQSFLLTIECSTISMYRTPGGKFKIFDSHARDAFGMPHSQGTCVLLEAQSIQDVTCYLQTLYENSNTLFEVIGVHIMRLERDDNHFVDENSEISQSELADDGGEMAHILTRNKESFIRHCCALSFYSICFSVVKACTYWNSQTLEAIIDHGNEFYKEQFSCPDESLCLRKFPNKLQIYDATIDVVFTAQKLFQNFILDNTRGNTGFIIWFSNYCASCIFQHNSKTKSIKYYLIIFHSDGTLDEFQTVSDSNFLLQVLANTVTKINTTNNLEVAYIIRFLNCYSNLSSTLRQKVLRKHKSSKQKNSLAEKRRESYANMEPSAKRKYLVSKAEWYKSLDPAKKEKFLSDRAEWYKSVTAAEKEKRMSDRAERYKSLDPAEKEKLLSDRAVWYKSLDPAEKDLINKQKKRNYDAMEPLIKAQYLNNKKQEYCTMNPIKKKKMIKCINDAAKISRKKANYVQHKLDHYISVFQNKIREGPYYICSVCHRILYRKTVMLLKENKYSIHHLFTEIKSFDDKQYICRTCHAKVSKGQVPCQAVGNKLEVDRIPPELSVLEKLEQILIAQRIVFEKIVVMPKGQQRKIKGAICNIPVECDQTCTTLPRPPERSGIIMLKLKRKMEFRGHVYFQAVRPQLILNALMWLKMNNSLYDNICIDIDKIDRHLKILQQNDNNSNDSTLNNDNHCTESGMSDDTSSNNENDENVSTSADEENDDPLNEYRAPTTETCLQSVIPDYPVTVEQNDNVSSQGDEVYAIAPGESKHPVSFMADKQCEELAFPILFPKGKYGYSVNREIKLSPVKYFNARLLHHSGRFATNPEYLFFAQFIIEQKKVSDSINIALKKMHGQPLTASQIRSNNMQNLHNLICQDQAYLFLRQIPGTPPYWQKFMYEVVAMVKQLGIPTWFMTLSCADLRWPELFQIIARTQGKNLTNEQVDALSYNERCSMLNVNPVVVAKHFQYRVETFFTEILLTNANPIGKIIYYALRIEFQMRGSPHLHALIWTSDCPELTHDTKEAYIHFIDEHVQSYLPDQSQDPELHELVKTYQKHSHSKTCRKYKNIKCRFNFGHFFTNKTIVAEPLSDDLNPEEKTSTIDRQKEILRLVKEKIDEVLNPSKANYDPTLTEADIFKSVNITKEQYYWALSISSDSDYELHLKRPTNSCFINNYFIAGIKGFRANVDLQPVFNHYKCITYVCSYFTKDETECSQAIMNAAKEAKKENLSVREGLKRIGAAFLSTREVSSQECVYRCMPELWLRKIFPATVFVSTDLPEKRVRIAKSPEELDELDNESTDIFKSNIIDRYTLRPQCIPSVDRLCLAEFAAYYYKEYKKNCQETADAQPEVLTDDVIELHHNCDPDTSPPDKIRLMNTHEVMKCRKVKAVIRYHKPNKAKEPELYFHHLLMLYYPWRDETSLLGSDQTYASKFYEHEVQAVVERNRENFEPDADAVTEALDFFRNNQGNIIHSSYDSMNDQENADLQSEEQDDSAPNESFNEQSPTHLVSSSETENHSNLRITSYHQPTEISDDKLRECVRSLNKRQRCAYDIILTWCRSKMKNMNSQKPEEVKPINLFITGGAGAGKSHLIHTIYHTVTKTFRHSPMNPELPTVLLMAPTGVAAINIDGTTINTALAIPKETDDNLRALSDQKKTQMRMLLADLKLIIIDEISMVANTTLLHIHQRLKEIFDTSNAHLFAGISIVAIGDMYQLPPIRRKPVFANYKNDLFNLYHPWHLFTMIELVDIMRQKDDQPFAELLNRFRTASQTEEDIQCIQSRSIDPSDVNYPSHALHIWAENNPVNRHNEMKLHQIPAKLFYLKATDQYPPNVSQQDINRILTRPRSETGGLDTNICIKESARVMLTNNIDIADRLINGQLGTVVKIEVNHNNKKPTIIYIKFDDVKAGNNLIQKSTSSFVQQNRVVPIEPVLAKIKIHPNKPSSPEIQRVQFPLTLAYAVSIHKVQGLSLNSLVISFELVKQRSFNYGQVYVALSRATSLNGIHILGNVNSKHVKADPRVHEEYRRLREISKTMESSEKYKDNAMLTICLLNIRSLKKHSIDIKYDANIKKSDLIALTETQLAPHSNDTHIKSHLLPFTLYRQDHPTDRYLSLALCTRRSIKTKEHEYFPQVNAMKFVIIKNTSTNMCPNFTVLFLYRKNNSNIIQYVSHLRNILGTYQIDIILGDFNINYLNDNSIRPLKSLMTSLGYSQFVQSPTFVSSGNILDQIYLKTTKFDIIENTIISVYYSDHDAVKISIKYN